MDPPPHYPTHPSSSFSIPNYLPPRETRRQYHQLMALFHQQTALSAMRGQQANIDPSLWGQGVSVETAQFAGGRAPGMPEECSVGAMYGAKVMEKGIVDPRLCSPATLQPAAVQDGCFPLATAGSVINGSVAGKRQGVAVQRYSRHGQDFNNPMKQVGDQGSGRNADNTAVKMITPAAGVVAATELGNHVSTITAPVPDPATTPAAIAEVPVAVQKRRSQRTKITPTARLTAAAQIDTSSTKIDLVATEQSSSVEHQKEGAPVKATSASEKVTQPDASPKEQRPKRRQVKRTKPPPALSSTAAPTPAPTLAPEPTPAVRFPHIARGKRDNTPAWYLESPSSASVDQAERTATGMFQCEVCGKEWPSRSALRRHSYKHTKHLKYRCTCGKVVTRGDSLKVHYKRFGCVPAEGGGLVDGEEE